jgi:hypothetical protein
MGESDQPIEPHACCSRYRAEYLAKVCTKPILVLCYNKALAKRLEHWMKEKGVANKVIVQNFHAWCYR